MKNATDHIFGIEWDARPDTKLLNFTTLDSEVLRGTSEDSSVISVAQATGVMLISC